MGCGGAEPGAGASGHDAPGVGDYVREGLPGQASLEERGGAGPRVSEEDIHKEAELLGHLVQLGVRRVEAVLPALRGRDEVTGLAGGERRGGAHDFAPAPHSTRPRSGM